MLAQLSLACYPTELLQRHFPDMPDVAFGIGKPTLASTGQGRASAPGTSNQPPTRSPLQNQTPKDAPSSAGASRSATRGPSALPPVSTRNTATTEVTKAARNVEEDGGISFHYVPLIQCSFPHADPGLAHNFTRQMTVMGHTTSLPVESNTITLDPTLTDGHGLPAIRVTYRDHEDDLKMTRFMQERAREIHVAAGARQVVDFPVGVSTSAAHLLGTCRMGNDPKSSVVDRFHLSLIHI